MSFFKKIFTNPSNAHFVEEFLHELFQACGLSLYCDVMEEEQNNLKIDIYGGDEELLTHHHGKLLRALQVYITGVLQNRMKPKKEDSRFYVHVDSQGFLEKHEKDLLDLAQKLKKKALKEKRPILLKRPMEAFQRRKIHQYLTQDGRVKTQSIGEGAVKTIKISPANKKMDQPE